MERPSITSCCTSSAISGNSQHHRHHTGRTQHESFCGLSTIFQSCITDFVRSAHANQWLQAPFHFLPTKARLVENFTHDPEKMLIFFADHLMMMEPTLGTFRLTNFHCCYQKKSLHYYCTHDQRPLNRSQADQSHFSHPKLSSYLA